MATTSKIPAFVPVSMLGRFVLADVKGGEQAHAYRKSVMEVALREALKGNHNPLNEARRVAADGKSQRVLAWRAGLEAVGDVDKVAYQGKLDSAANKAARDEIDAATARLLSGWNTAFNSAVDAAKAASKAAKEAKTAQKDADAEQAHASALREQREQEAGDASVARDIEVADVVQAVVMAIQQGIVSGEEATMLRAALAAYDAAQTEQATILPAGSSLSPLLQAPALAA
jgi:hypothetical protein